MALGSASRVLSASALGYGVFKAFRWFLLTLRGQLYRLLQELVLFKDHMGRGLVNNTHCLV